MSKFTMKSTVFRQYFGSAFVVIGVLTAAVFAADPPPQTSQSEGPYKGIIMGPPPLTIEPPALDFGFIAPGEEKTGIFTLKNPSNVPLTIVALQPTCTCTSTTDLTGRVIAPGESLQFDASLAAAIATGPRKSTVKVIVQGYSKPLEVDVRAEVVVALRAVPPAINVLPNVPVAGRVVIESIDRKPFRILSVDNAPPSFIGFDPAKDGVKSTYLVRYDLTRFARDELPAWCLLQTDRADAPVMALKIRNEKMSIVPVVRMKEYNLNLGLIPANGFKDFTFDMVDWEQTVSSVASLSELFTVELLAQERQGKDIQVRCRVTPKPYATGLVQFLLELKTGLQSQKLWAYGMVREIASIPAPSQANTPIVPGVAPPLVTQPAK